MSERTLDPVFDVDWFALLARDVLRERTPALVADACAWAVGLSDGAHLVRRDGRTVPSGLTVGERAVRGLPLAADAEVRVDLADAAPGTFRDVLGALTSAGGTHAERFDAEVLAPFVLDTCVRAAERAGADRPADWLELAHDVGEDPADPVAVVRAGDWEAPLRMDAEHLALAALGDLPLIEVEAEGLPLSLVRAAEALVHDASTAPPPPSGDGASRNDASGDDDLAGVLFLAGAAVDAADLPDPVPPDAAAQLLAVLRAEGLEDAEILSALPRLRLAPATIDRVARLVDSDA